MELKNSRQHKTQPFVFKVWLQSSGSICYIIKKQGQLLIIGFVAQRAAPFIEVKGTSDKLYYWQQEWEETADESIDYLPYRNWVSIKNKV